MLDYSTFIGSNVDTYKFDVFNKSGQSKAGCPVTLKKATSSLRLAPTSSAWQEFTSNEYNLVRYLDGNSITVSTATAGELAQILVEVDLSQLVTTKGNLETLKGLVSSIKVVAHARAEGSFTNTLVSKCNIMMWDSTQWNSTYMGERTGSGIQEIITPNTSIPSLELGTWSQARIGGDNKIYALISCPNSAGTTIPSKVLLDFVTVYLDLRRSPDKIVPKEVKLESNWSLLIKGVSPVTLSNSPLVTSPITRTLGIISQEFKTSKAEVRISSNGKIEAYFQSQGEIPTSLVSSAPSVTKDYKPYNILFQHSNGKYTLSVRNNGQTYTDTKTYTAMPIGVYKYNIMQTIENTQQANSFFDTWEISDHVFSDTELEVILSGRNEKVPNNEYLNSLADIYSNPNLAPNFMDSRWSWSKDIVVSHKQPDIVAFSTASTYTGSSITFDVIPNTTYEITCDITGDSGHIVWRQLSNSNLITQGVASTVVTSEYTNQLVVVLQNREAGNFIFSNLRVRRLD